MYVCPFLCCMGVDMTSGFDTTLIGTLQFSPPWNVYLSDGTKDDKGKPTLPAGLLGFVSSCCQLGSIIGVPLAPWFNQRFGWRWSVMMGSIMMVIGALIQGFAQDHEWLISRDRSEDAFAILVKYHAEGDADSVLVKAEMTRINLANACWSLITAGITAFVVARLKRRFMFVLSSATMLLVFISMTILFEKLREAKNHKTTNKAAGAAALFFYLAYCASLQYWKRRSHLRGFFSNNVNPIALEHLDWKFLAIYCGCIAFEFSFIYFMYPETSGRTLEELAFLFEDKELADQAVEKQIHHEDMGDEKRAIAHVEERVGL
ncbi:hypothetical protein BDZ45DRAFT_725466 [Acephala macrosclerotiorum]|nr:hypothetical protein BDZ45DRAFT_725466 [Acephala macrosclerotiorum]